MYTFFCASLGDTCNTASAGSVHQKYGLVHLIISLFVGVGVEGTYAVSIHHNSCHHYHCFDDMCLKKKTNKLNITDNVVYTSPASLVK